MKNICNIDIKAGTLVKVVNTGKVFNTYGDWAETYHLTGFVRNGVPRFGETYEVVCIAPHGERANSGTLAGIRDTTTGQEFIIGVDGLALDWSAKIKEVITNGVDSEGNPRNFTKADLKQFQRVVTKNGDEWIVVEHSNGELYLTTTGEKGFCDVVFEPQECEFAEAYRAVEVYDTTGYISELLKINRRGELIWKYSDPAPPQPSEFETRLAYFQTHIDAVEENLESLKRELEILKEK